MWKLFVILFVYAVSAQQAPILISITEVPYGKPYPKLEVRHTSSDVLGIVIYRKSNGEEVIDTLNNTAMVFYDFSILPLTEYTYSCATLTSTGVTERSTPISITTRNFWWDSDELSYTESKNNRLTIKKLNFSDITLKIRRREYSSGTEVELPSIRMKQASRYQINTASVMYTTIIDTMGCKLLDVYEYIYTPVYDTTEMQQHSFTRFFTGGYSHIEEIRDLSHLKIIEKTEKVGEVSLYENSWIRGNNCFVIDSKVFVKEFSSGLTVLDIEDPANPVVETVLTSPFALGTDYFSFEDSYFSFVDSKALVQAKYKGDNFEIINSVGIHQSHDFSGITAINDSLSFENTSAFAGDLYLRPITFYRNEIDYRDWSSGHSVPSLGQHYTFSREFFRPNSMLVKGSNENYNGAQVVKYRQVVYSPVFGVNSAIVPNAFLPHSDYSTYGSDVNPGYYDHISFYPYVLPWEDSTLFRNYTLKFSAIKIDSTRNLIYGFDRENHKLEIISFEVADTSSESIIDVDNYPKAGNSFSIRALKTASSISFSGLKENRKYSAEIFLLNGKRVVNTVLASEMNSLNIAHLAEGAFIIVLNELHTKKQAYIGRFTIGN